MSYSTPESDNSLREPIFSKRALVFPTLLPTMAIKSTMTSYLGLLNLLLAIVPLASLSMAIQISTNKNAYLYNESIVISWDYDGTTPNVDDFIVLCPSNASFPLQFEDFFLFVYVQSGMQELPTSADKANGTITFDGGPPQEQANRPWPLVPGDYIVAIGESTQGNALAKSSTLRISYATSIPSAQPSAAPVKTPAPIAPAPMASPVVVTSSCGLLGLNFFCPRPRQCGFWKRLFNIGSC
jgi:hypothetical protein